MSEVGIAQLHEQLRALGVRRGGVLLVHTSFKAVGPVEGGPLGLIAALHRAIGNDGTLVMPTMTDGESKFDPKIAVALEQLEAEPLVFLCSPEEHCEQCDAARGSI